MNLHCKIYTSPIKPATPSTVLIIWLPGPSIVLVGLRPGLGYALARYNIHHLYHSSACWLLPQVSQPSPELHKDLPKDPHKPPSLSICPLVARKDWLSTQTLLPLHLICTFVVQLTPKMMDSNGYYGHTSKFTSSANNHNGCYCTPPHLRDISRYPALWGHTKASGRNSTPSLTVNIYGAYEQQ